METKHISLGHIGVVAAVEVHACDNCCYRTYGDPTRSPVINGTHLLNGTDIVPVTRGEVGYSATTGGALYLPCSMSYITNVVYYRAESASTSNLPNMLVLLLPLLVLAFVVRR